MAFLVDHTRRLMLRYQAGRDGRTGSELHLVSRPYRRQLVDLVKERT